MNWRIERQPRKRAFDELSQCYSERHFAAVLWWKKLWSLLVKHFCRVSIHQPSEIHKYLSNINFLQ